MTLFRSHLSTLPFLVAEFLLDKKKTRKKGKRGQIPFVLKGV